MLAQNIQKSSLFDWQQKHCSALQVDSEQNVVLISIPSVVDPSLAPAGKHTLHAYLPATEPYELWEGLDRRSAEYEALKEERSQVGSTHCPVFWLFYRLDHPKIHCFYIRKFWYVLEQGIPKRNKLISNTQPLVPGTLNVVQGGAVTGGFHAVFLVWPIYRWGYPKIYHFLI